MSETNPESPQDNAPQGEGEPEYFDVHDGEGDDDIPWFPGTMNTDYEYLRLQLQLTFCTPIRLVAIYVEGHIGQLWRWPLSFILH